jgi:hypothetical protein
MILQFLFLLDLELSSNDTSGRLVAHLSSLQETLFKWSNAPTLTLWSALGFSKPSSMPVKLRLVFRFLATFIASGLLKEENHEEKSKLGESFDLFLGGSEFADCGIHVAEMRNLVNSEKSLGELYEMALSISGSLYPELVSLISPEM